MTDRETIPLCVDLDGTLLATDSLDEQALLFLQGRPWRIWRLLVWLGQGKARLKRELNLWTEARTDLWPCHSEFLSFLQEEHQKGRRLLLVTGADQALALRVATRFAIFDGVEASQGDRNLTGPSKAARLVELFGSGGFDYAGNSTADLSIWKEAREAIVVNASPALEGMARREANVTRVFGRPAGWPGPLRRVLRVHQWPKNVLLLIPVITGHKLRDPRVLLEIFLAFVAFSLCASCVYVINDLHDVEADRQHRTKKNRPFAAGTFPIRSGLALIPILLGLSLVLAWSLPGLFLLCLAGYFLTSVLYSAVLRKIALLDVFILAGLYTIRILAGSAATGINCSNWLLAFSVFLFLSLALLKRYIELRGTTVAERPPATGRDYSAADLNIVQTVGLISGYFSALVLAIYVNSEEVRLLYRQPALLMAVCPLILYWITRVWFLAARGRVEDDPVMFALKDRPSYVLGALVGASILLAS